MSITRTHDQTLRALGVLFVILLIFSGCTRKSLNARSNQILRGFSQPIRVSAVDADAAEPAIAASPDGSVYVAWVNHGPKQADVMIARFTGDGQLPRSAVRVNSLAGIATAWRGDPPTVAVAPDGTVFVGWTGRAESESGHATNLYLSSSRDNGQTFSAPAKVNDDTKPGVHGMHSLAVGNDGRVYLAWLDERNVKPMPMKDTKMNGQSSGRHMESNRELFFASSTDGGHSFTPNQRVAHDACPCCKTALAIKSDGHVYVSWRQVLSGDLRHIAVASSPDQGKTFGAPVIVSDDQWVLAGCPVSGSTLSVDERGTLSVLWYSAGNNGETGLYWCQSKDNGATFGSRQLVASGLTKGTPVLVVANGAFTGVWENNESGQAKVMTAKLDAAAAASETFTVASDSELPAAAATTQGIVIAYTANSDQHQGVWVVYEQSTRDPGSR